VGHRCRVTLQSWHMDGGVRSRLPPVDAWFCRRRHLVQHARLCLSLLHDACLREGHAPRGWILRGARTGTVCLKMPPLISESAILALTAIRFCPSSCYKSINHRFDLFCSFSRHSLCSDLQCFWITRHWRNVVGLLVVH